MHCHPHSMRQIHFCNKFLLHYSHTGFFRQSVLPDSGYQPATFFLHVQTAPVSFPEHIYPLAV